MLTLALGSLTGKSGWRRKDTRKGSYRGKKKKGGGV